MPVSNLKTENTRLKTNIAHSYIHIHILLYRGINSKCEYRIKTITIN